MIQVAETSGRLLGEYLREKENQEVVLVGQSLGAVVALSAADRLRSELVPRCLILLGAAVDEFKLIPKAGLYGYTPLAGTEAVAWSSSDRILRFVFGIGERRRAPHDTQLGPVGLTGEPRARGWQEGRATFAHHKYWDEPWTGDFVSRVIRSSPSGYRNRGWRARIHYVPTWDELG
jgi:pimeloyl-ACP methyl ester carboxylesterase